MKIINRGAKPTYLHIWDFIQKNLSKEIPVALNIVAEHKKGSPGKRGFKMAINLHGEFAGTIGGGIMEWDLLNQSKEQLKRQQTAPILSKLIHRKTHKDIEKKSSGLICSGEQNIIQCSIYPGNEAIFNGIKSILEEKGMMIEVSSQQFNLRELATYTPPFFQEGLENKWTYTESISPLMNIFIIGGGHVGKACAQILSQLDSIVTVFDHRENAIIQSYPDFFHKFILCPMSSVGEFIQCSFNSFAIVVSSSFQSDEEALAQILQKNINFIGLMGSQAKIFAIKKNLRKRGFGDEQLNRIQAPIGLQIGSETPHEIAVSIAGDIIREARCINRQ